jgi:hypothetical protein
VRVRASIAAGALRCGERRIDKAKAGICNGGLVVHAAPRKASGVHHSAADCSRAVDGNLGGVPLPERARAAAKSNRSEVAGVVLRSSLR